MDIFCQKIQFRGRAFGENYSRGAGVFPGALTVAQASGLHPRFGGHEGPLYQTFS
jgi:hypothetical protein